MGFSTCTIHHSAPIHLFYPVLFSQSPIFLLKQRSKPVSAQAQNCWMDFAQFQTDAHPFCDRLHWRRASNEYFIRFSAGLCLSRGLPLQLVDFGRKKTLKETDLFRNYYDMNASLIPMGSLSESSSTAKFYFQLLPVFLCSSVAMNN